MFGWTWAARCWHGSPDAEGRERADSMHSPLRDPRVLRFQAASLQSQLAGWLKDAAAALDGGLLGC